MFYSFSSLHIISSGAKEKNNKKVFFLYAVFEEKKREKNPEINSLINVLPLFPPTFAAAAFLRVMVSG
jgi:hypothetical protein